MLDAYYITVAGDLVGIIPPGETINTDASFAGTTLKVRGPFTAYDPTTKVVSSADGRQICLLHPEKTKVLAERTKAWLSKFTSH